MGCTPAWEHASLTRPISRQIALGGSCVSLICRWPLNIVWIFSPSDIRLVARASWGWPLRRRFRAGFGGESWATVLVGAYLLEIKRLE